MTGGITGSRCVYSGSALVTKRSIVRKLSTTIWTVQIFFLLLRKGSLIKRFYCTRYRVFRASYFYCDPLTSSFGEATPAIRITRAANPSTALISTNASPSAANLAFSG